MFVNMVLKVLKNMFVNMVLKNKIFKKTPIHVLYLRNGLNVFILKIILEMTTTYET
jgi:hypothetical protein